jgi:protein-L-isoaspartate O-methyltransferase
MIRALLLSFTLSFTLGFATAARAQTPVNAGPYVPSPTSVVSDMLTLASVGPNDFVIDLGSGDGRIVLTAAKVFGARGFGVEIKDELVQLSNEAAQKQGVADRVKFMTQDLFKTDVSQATVLTMYLLPNTVNMLSEKLLKELKPGTRIISHDYPLSGWLAERTLEMDLQEKVTISGVTLTILYLYIVPAMVSGNWSASVPASVAKRAMSIELTQQITKVSGSAKVDGKVVPLENVKLKGDRIRFGLAGRKGVEFTGSIKGNLIEGEVAAAGVKTPWSAKLTPKT